MDLQPAGKERKLHTFFKIEYLIVNADFSQYFNKDDEKYELNRIWCGFIAGWVKERTVLKKFTQFQSKTVT
jgi:hypothetical protein